MPLVVNDKSQTFCDVAEEGWQWMRCSYDTMPPWMREIVRESRFNICAACFIEQYRRWRKRLPDDDDRTVARMLLADFEHRIEDGA